MYKLGNFFIFLAIAPLILALWVQGFFFLISLPNAAALLWFGIGLVAMLLLGIALRGTLLHFSEVATHEMTHALAGWPFMGEAALMEARANAHSPGPGVTGWISNSHHVNFLVMIAPYSFPVLAIPPLILEFLPFAQRPPASIAIDILLGATLAFHYLSIWDALGVPQSDLIDVGTIAGFAVAMTFQMLFLIVALSVLVDTPRLIGEYVAASWTQTRVYYGAIFAAVAQSLAEITRP